MPTGVPELHQRQSHGQILRRTDRAVDPQPFRLQKDTAARPSHTQPALAFGKNSVESQRGFSRAGQSGDHGESAVGNGDVYIFQIVHSRACHRKRVEQLVVDRLKVNAKDASRLRDSVADTMRLPLHRGHAPNGELNEKLCGAGSR